jgi:uncharacterized membrane protein
MLKLSDYKTIFVVVGGIGILLLASPVLSLVLHFPMGEKFSELWLLGPEHMAENYPFNIKANDSYLVYVGVNNHMRSSAYYVVYVKFKNQSEELPNTTLGRASPLPPLYEYRTFLQDNESWEAPLNFSFIDFSFSQNRTRVTTLRINDVVFSVNESSLWDADLKGCYFELFIELWIYDAEVNAFQFQNRFVDRWLNMTIPS